MASGSLHCVAISYRPCEAETILIDEDEMAQRELPEGDLVLLAIVGLKVMFPSTLLGTSENWTLLKTISVTEYLNYEGDILFIWIDLQAKLNTQLLNNLGNFINRVLSFIAKDPDSRGGRGLGYNSIILDAPGAETHLLSKTLGDKIDTSVAGQVAALVLCDTRELAYHVIFSFVTVQQFENVNFHPCLTLCVLGEICCRELAYQARLVKNRDNNEIKGFVLICSIQASMESIHDSLAEAVQNYGQKCMLSGLKPELEALRRRHSDGLELMGFEVFDGKE
uniref:Uncharacterized protein n=1 Tax=Lactuca sativa TaxID=4236 RepID=A0A9R1VAT3_LACSA|nr:hypothetical protein LSAT_V11C600336500 [Lactuca sativa]